MGMPGWPVLILGVRPNSPMTNTSVSLSMPRSSRSAMSAATARSMARMFGAWPATSEEGGAQWDERGARLDEPAGHEGVAAPRVVAVAVDGARVFLGHVERPRDGRVENHRQRLLLEGVQSLPGASVGLTADVVELVQQIAPVA